jgi:hypothetical protein
MEGGDPMTNPMQPDPDRLRVALDNGETVELDGGTLMLGNEESPSVLLRLAPWRARSVARVLEEWSAVSRVFHRAPRPILTELELSRTLDLAASVLGDPEPPMPLQRGGHTVESRQRLDAVAVLAERESRLSALQRLALVDAAASWLSEPNGGEQHRTVGIRTAEGHTNLLDAGSRSLVSDVINSAGRKLSLASLALATFELLYESAGMHVRERILPPVRVVVDRC